jgi:uncharacterized protein
VRFWDSSALVPALVQEPTTAVVLDLLADDPAVTVWWATQVECEFAIARLVREGAIDPPDAFDASRRLDALREGWQEVAPSDRLRREARRLVRLHPLRAADAFQLAAALASSENTDVAIVSLDTRLRDAAAVEGFAVAPQQLV